jgi:hypothetical protein
VLHDPASRTAAAVEDVVVSVLFDGCGNQSLMAFAHDGVAMRLPLPDGVGKLSPEGATAVLAPHKDSMLALADRESGSGHWADGGDTVRMAICGMDSPERDGLREIGFGWWAAAVGAAVVRSASLEPVRLTSPHAKRLAMAAIERGEGPPGNPGYWLCVAYWGAIEAYAPPRIRALYQGTEVRLPLPQHIAAVLDASGGKAPSRGLLEPMTAEILSIARSAAIDPANWRPATPGRRAPGQAMLFSRGHEMIALPG